MKSLTVKPAPFLTLMVFMLIGFFLLGSFSSGVANAEANTASPSEISVNGTGVILVKPDIGIINIGIETSNKDSKISQDENTKQSTQLVEALKKAGIGEEDIKTSYYNMYRERFYNDGRQQEGDYKVVHSFEVTVRDINKVGATIDTAAKNGANQINNVRFTMSDNEKHYLEALSAAIKNAEGKAETIAKTLGVTIGKPSKVVEAGYSEPYGKYMDVRLESAADMSVTPIASGDLEIKAYVNVTYNY